MLTTFPEAALAPLHSDRDLAEVYLDWSAANEDAIAAVNPFDSPRIDLRSRRRLRDQASATLREVTPRIIGRRVEEADAMVDILARRSPAEGEEPVARLLLWQALAVACAESLTTNDALVLATDNEEVRAKIRRGYRARLSQIGRDLAASDVQFRPDRRRLLRSLTRLDSAQVADLLETTSGGRSGYRHMNSLGVTYFLNSKMVTLRGGKEQTIYFFSKQSQPETATDLPTDRVVNENPRNGFLTLKRK